MSLSEKSGLRLWLWQRISAAYLVFGIFLHFAVTHFLGEPLRFANVNLRLQNLLWVLFDLSLLVAALVHGFGGLWSIYLDYNPKGNPRRFFGWIVVFLVGIFGIYGIFALRALST